jgi:predicted phosphodiesterase
LPKHIYTVRKGTVALDADIDRLVFVSDLHGSIEPLVALSGLLAGDPRNTKVVSCGDMLAAPCPEEVVNWVFQNCTSAAILGNHDEIARAVYRDGVNQYPWTQSEAERFGALRPDLQEYMRTLHDEIDIAWRGKKIRAMHGHRTHEECGVNWKSRPSEIVNCFSDDPTADLTVVGHTHFPFVRRAANGTLIANCGSTSLVTLGMLEPDGIVTPHDDVEVFAPGQQIFSSYVSVTLEQDDLHAEIVKFDYDRSAFLERVQADDPHGFEAMQRLVESGVM